MTKVQVNIYETIRKAAIKEFDKEKKQEQKKKVFYNTRLLLKHYNDLKQHVNNAIDDIRKLEPNLISFAKLDRDEIYIESIKRSKSKTLIMIAHKDFALAVLKQKQYDLCSMEKYEALKLFYLDELTYVDISEKLLCNERTVRRWVKDMTDELGILIFGIDAISM